MTVTDRDLKILELLTLFYVLSPAQVRRLVFPNDKEGRITRRRINFLLANDLINKTRQRVFNPMRTDGTPVLYPSKAGCTLLAMRKGDVRYLQANTTAPAMQNIVHWLTLSELHATILDSFARQDRVTMPAWINEFDVVNKDEVDPAKKYELYTVISQTPKKVCVPDAAYVMSDGRFQMANYIELECGTSSPQKAAAEKTPGYAGLDREKLHKRHFPGALDTFRVLMFAPTPNWRDALRKAFALKEGATLWRFASMTEVNAESYLTKPIFYTTADAEPPMALLKGK